MIPSLRPAKRSITPRFSTIRALTASVADWRAKAAAPGKGSPQIARPRRSRMTKPVPAADCWAKTPCARAQLAEWAAAGGARRLIVVAPTSHLKLQWSLAAHRLGLQLDPDWSADYGLARDVHGLIEHLKLDRPTIVGWSMGGLTTFEYLRQFGHEHLRSVVLVDQTPRLRTDEAWSMGLFGAYTAMLVVVALGMPVLFFYGKRLRMWTAGSVGKGEEAKKIVDDDDDSKA